MKKQSIYDVKITRTLLEKPESGRTEIENKAVKEYEFRMSAGSESAREINDEIRQNCRMLCSGIERDLVVEEGWRYPIRDMAYKLEKLNYFYRRYGLKVTFDQVKEKFGTFRGYYSIRRSPLGFFGLFAKCARAAAEFINGHFTFARRRVEDSPEFVQLQWEECGEKEYREKLGRCGKKLENSSVWKTEELVNDTPIYIGGAEYPQSNTYFKAEGGKYYRSYWLTHPAKCHYEQVNHRFLFKTMNMFRCLEWFFGGLRETTAEENVMLNVFDGEVEALVRECERECAKFCQRCGRGIDEEGCETHGWITYVCRECAAAGGGTYYDRKKKKWYKELKPAKNPYSKFKKADCAV